MTTTKTKPRAWRRTPVGAWVYFEGDRPMARLIFNGDATQKRAEESDIMIDVWDVEMNTDHPDYVLPEGAKRQGWVYSGWTIDGVIDAKASVEQSVGEHFGEETDEETYDPARDEEELTDRKIHIMEGLLDSRMLDPESPAESAVFAMTPEELARFSFDYKTEAPGHGPIAKLWRYAEEFVPAPGLIVIVEDREPWREALKVRVASPDGEKVIHLLDEYNGAKRKPDQRRGRVVAIGPPAKREFRKYTGYRVIGVKGQTPDGQLAEEQPHLKRFFTTYEKYVDPNLKLGDWVFFGKDYGPTEIRAERLTFRLLGLHQIFYKEAPDVAAV